MANIVSTLFHRFRNLILYGIIGSLSAGTDFTLYSILVRETAIPYLLINVFSTFVGIVISYLLNRKYNFKVEDNAISRFLIFLSIGIGGLVVSSLLLYLFVEFWSIDKTLSKIISLVVVVLIQYLLNKYITFKTRKYA